MRSTDMPLPTTMVANPALHQASERTFARRHSAASTSAATRAMAWVMSSMVTASIGMDRFIGERSVLSSPIC